MKILIVSSYYPPHLGGLEIVAFNHAKYLAAHGNEVTVLTSSVNKNETSHSSGGVDVIRVKALNLFEKKWGVPFPIFSPRFITSALRAVKNADIVHVHDVFYISSFIAMLCAYWYNKPAVLMQHVEMIKHPSKIVVLVQKMIFATFGAFIFKHSKKIITLNDRVDRFILDRGVAQSKIIALPNGVDAELFLPVTDSRKLELKQKFGLSLEKKVALFVGRFVPKKGFDKLLSAKSTEYQLVFAGGKTSEKSDDGAVFLGTMSQNELVEVYQAADIFVLPSEGEGFPLSIQEAMASGLPIITTNDSGYERYKFDKDKMHFLDDPTASSINVAIRKICCDGRCLKAMADHSRSYVLENFNWPIIIRKLEAVYAELAADE